MEENTEEMSNMKEEYINNPMNEEQIDKQEVDENDIEADESIELMRQQLREKQQKNLKRIEKNSKRNDVKRYKISGIVAGIAGVLSVISGVINGDYTMECMGITFICCGYFFWNMAKRSEREKKRQGR